MAEIVWEEIVRCRSGLYRIDAAQRERFVQSAALAPPFHLVILDGETIHERSAFFAALADALHFPDYFGHNWDAVYDCLTDPSWLPGDGVVLVLDGFAPFAAAHPEQWQIALKVFRDAGAFWQPLDRSLYVLLSGVAEEQESVETLPDSCLSESDNGA